MQEIISGDDLEDMDLAGLDEIISGDDDIDDLLAGDEIISGGNPRAMAGLNLIKKLGFGKLVAKQQAVAKKKALLQRIALQRGRPALVRTRTPMVNVDLPVTWATASLAPGLSSLVTINAPALWDPYDLIVPSDVASSFSIISLTMGFYTFNPGGQPLKLLSFTEDATSRRQWKLPTIQPGQPLLMVIQNTSTAFTGVCAGEWWGKLVG